MEPIASKTVKEAQESKRNRLLTFIILGLLVLSSVGYAFLSNPSQEAATPENKQQGPVYADGNRWAADFAGQKLSFGHHPDAIATILSNVSVTFTDYYGRLVYIDADSASLQEIALNLGPYTERLQPACYGSCASNLPERNCTDLFIVVNSSAPKQIYGEGKCVFINGGLDAVDSFLYTLFDLRN